MIFCKDCKLWYCTGVDQCDIKISKPLDSKNAIINGRLISSLSKDELNSIRKQISDNPRLSASFNNATIYSNNEDFIKAIGYEKLDESHKLIPERIQMLYDNGIYHQLEAINIDKDGKIYGHPSQFNKNNDCPFFEAKTSTTKVVESLSDEAIRDYFISLRNKLVAFIKKFF